MRMRLHAQVMLAVLLVTLVAVPVSAISNVPANEGKVIVLYLRGDAPSIPFVYEGDAVVAAEMRPSDVFGSRPLQVIDPVISLGRSRFDPSASSDNWKWSGPGLYIVQFKGPVDLDVKNTLTTLGMKVMDYVPRFAYLAWMDEDVVGSLAGWGYVRAVVRYMPETKISPNLDGVHGEVLIIALGVHGKMGDTPKSIAESVGGRLISAYELGGYVYLRFLGDAGSARTLAERNDISWIERTNMITLEDERSAQVIAGNIPVVPGYKAWLQQKGVDGNGIAVGHVDTGLYSAHLDLAGRVIDINSNGQDGNGHGTHTAGICCGDASSNKDDGSGYQYGQGIAPKAKIISITKNILSDKENMHKIAENNGSVTTFSWNMGYSGAYGAAEREFDFYVLDASDSIPGEQPVSITFSAGNQGPNPGTITSPHCAKDIIAVGSTLSPRSSPADVEQLNDFSSRGPCEDGRIKPDVSAPGDSIYSAKTGTTDQHQSMSGTSMACPHVAGATALIQQWYKNKYGTMPMPSLVKALHINGAADMTGVAAGIPNMEEGWGRINLNNVIENGIDMYYENEKNSLDTGQSADLTAGVSDQAKPFKVTLVWSDAPGAAGAKPAIVNDLDLIVEGSEGVYNGNNFLNGWSQTGGSADNLNNMESVYIKSPTTSYTIKVVGKNVPQGPQRFSLAVYNTKLTTSSLKLSKPSGGELFKGGQKTQVSWTSSGALVQNSVNISFSKDGGSTWGQVVSGQPANGTYQWTVPMENTTNGMIKVDAKDTGGGALESKSGAFTIDSGPPVSKVDALPAYTLKGTFNVSFTANDTLSGLDKAQLFYRKGSVGQFTPGQKTNKSPISFTAPSDGRFEFYTIASDKVGNNETPKIAPESWTFVDTVKPFVTLAVPANNSKDQATNLTVKLTFSEGMNKSSVKVTVSPSVTPNSPTWGKNDTELSFALNNLMLKTDYTISITGKDLAGWDLGYFSMKFTTMDKIIVPATVDGNVRDGTTSKAISGASVKAYKSGTTTVINETTTDASGDYMLKLPPGTYDLNVSASGYEPAQVTLTLAEAGSETKNFDLYKVGSVPGTVTGIVKDTGGTPIAYATVYAGNATSTTSGTGSYTLKLTAGDYTVTAKAPSYISNSTQVTVKSRQTITHDFILKKQPTQQNTDVLAGVLPWLIVLIIIIAVIGTMAALVIMKRRRRASIVICPYCKSESPIGTQNCPHCGLLLNNPQKGLQPDQQLPPEPQSQPQYPQYPQSPPSQYPPQQDYPQQGYSQQRYPPEGPPLG